MKITIDYDTASKKADVTVDGKMVENVVGVDFQCKYDYENDKMSDKYQFRMQSIKKNEDKSTEVYTVMASENDEFIQVEPELEGTLNKVDASEIRAFVSKQLSLKK